MRNVWYNLNLYEEKSKAVSIKYYIPLDDSIEARIYEYMTHIILIRKIA